jgi:hypothetical protein
MTDIEICQRDIYVPFTPSYGVGPPVKLRRVQELYWNTAMTLEILHWTYQIKNWINIRVARHLEAQAARLTHY